jgi:hypothetical protein
MALGTRHDVEPPERPVIVVCLDGWIDAGFAGATAAETLLESLPMRTLVTYDGEDLIDQRARRPRLRVDDGRRGPLTWQEPRLVVGKDRSDKGVALLVGPEPDYHWRAFSREVVGLAKELDAPMLIALGAFPAATPHTRPIRLASVSTDLELVHRVGFVPGSIDVPAGISDAIFAEAANAEIASIGLWARMPHYLSGTPYPQGAVVLLEGLIELAGLDLDITDLQVQAREARDRVDELIAASDEHTDMVRQLESQPDRPVASTFEEELPSGEEIAAELERYLRGELS